MSQENWRTALYARLSVELINRKSESIENQLELMRKYISGKPEFSEIFEYTDKGFTGTDFYRPAFENMMADVRSGKINCIIVKDLSRLGRDYLETSNLIETIFPFLGVRFISVNDHFDTNEEHNGNKELEIALKNLVNDMYARDVSKRVSTSRKQDQIRGKFLESSVPYGYKIKDNNHLRQEWNYMVDRGLISGMTEDELVEIKRQYIDKEVAESVKTHGNQPSLFTQLLQRAIGKLRALIDFFIIFQDAEKDENGEALLYEDVVLDITPVALPPRDKGPYPSSEFEKLEVIRLENIDKKLKSGNRKVYAIEKNIKSLKKQLEKVSKGLFHRKERKTLEDKIATKQFELEKAKSNLDAIPMMNGFANAAAFYKAFKKAKAALAAKEKLQEEWSRPDPMPAKEYWRVHANAKKEPLRETQREEKRGIKERLAENKAEIAKQSQKPKKKNQGIETVCNLNNEPGHF